MRKSVIMVGIGAGLGLGAVLLATRAHASEDGGGDGGGGGSCFTAVPGLYYEVIWRGSDMLLPSAFGSSVWNDIYTVELFNSETGDWDPPSAPENYIIHNGDRCRFKLQQLHQVCGFSLVS